MRRLLVLSTLLLAATAGPAAAAPPPLQVHSPSGADGLELHLSWAATPGVPAWAIVRSNTENGPWTLVAGPLPGETTELSDKVTTDPVHEPPADAYWYRLVALPDVPLELDASVADQGGPAVRGKPSGAWFRADVGGWALFLLIVAVGGLMLRYTRLAQAGHKIEIRRIPGIDAIEEGIGRATEMGKPVLYVPGIDELQDIQTIASMLILGPVSRTVAEYQTEIIVSCCIPIVREVADEVVKAGFFQAGHPDAYIPSNTRFISSEQFAFCAGTNGIIHREKPATNLYLGRFFAESLILAETGFVNKSIQIAGTAEATQLPFFIAACDYTLIGEELFAVSAYLSGDPRLVSSLRASDQIKAVVVVCLALGVFLATLGKPWIATLFTLVGG